MKNIVEKFKGEAVRAVATFSEVFLSVLIGDSLMTDMSVNTLQMAAMSGMGAALSVLYNFVRKFRSSLPGSLL
jgi:hypothetical protein